MKNLSEPELRMLLELLDYGYRAEEDRTMALLPQFKNMPDLRKGCAERLELIRSLHIKAQVAFEALP